jgi:hypothetical protein
MFTDVTRRHGSSKAVQETSPDMPFAGFCISNVTAISQMTVTLLARKEIYGRTVSKTGSASICPTQADLSMT